LATDPYLDPVTGVLRNKLGITDPAVLARLEGDIAAVREIELIARRPKLGTYDLAHLRAIHRHLFDDVYEWAGEPRTIDISKGTTTFAHHGFLEIAAGNVFADLAARGHLRGLARPAFVAGAGRLLGDLNALHPFRDGNGRAQRVFLQLLANDAGWALLWGRVEPEENFALSIASESDLDALVPLVDRITVPFDPTAAASTRVLPHRP
jgi:cell filamentation protein